MRVLLFVFACEEWGVEKRYEKRRDGKRERERPKKLLKKVRMSFGHQKERVHLRGRETPFIEKKNEI